MFVALSRIKAASASESALREAFLSRSGQGDDVPGFLGLEVFAGAEDVSLCYLITRWKDAASFGEWNGSSIPGGLEVDASFTQVPTPAAEFLRSSASVYWLKASPEGLLLACNSGFRDKIGQGSLLGSPIWPLLTEPDAASLRQAVHQGTGKLAGPYRLNFVDRNQMPFTLECRIDLHAGWLTIIGEPVREDEARLQREMLALNNRLAVEMRENARQTKLLRQAKADLERAVVELVESRRHLTNLQEVIPICMVCGKVKNRDARWEDVAAYFLRNNLSLSHGYCPACFDKEMEKLEQ